MEYPVSIRTEAVDFAKAFCALHPAVNHDVAKVWFAKAMMRGFIARNEMQRLGITARQKAALDFITKYIGEKGVSPSFEEIAVALDIKSRGNVTRIISCLCERGWIRFTPGIARSIAIAGQM